MTPRERLLSALEGGQPDRVRIFEWPFNLDLYETYLGYRPQAYNGRDAARVAMKIGLDGVSLFVSSADDHKDIWIDARQYRDEWGVLRQKDPAAWPLDAPIGEVIGGFEALANYKGPDLRAKGRTRDLRQALEEAKGRMALIVAIEGPLSMSTQIAGPERFMLLCYYSPELVDHLAQVCTDFGIVTGQRAVNVGADALIIADD